MKYLVSLIIALAPLAPAFGDNTMLKLYNKDYEDMIWQDRTGQHKVEIQTDDNQSQQCSIRYKLGTGMQVGQYVPYLDCR